MAEGRSDETHTTAVHCRPLLHDGFHDRLRAAGRPAAIVDCGKTKQSIVTFVSKVTEKGSPDFVPPAERIATFDNDGTLWAEQPLYFQFLFAMDR